MRVQVLSVPQHRRTSRGGKKPAWLGKELQIKLRDKKNVYKQCKHECVTWEEYRDAIRVCRYRIREVRVQRKVHVVRNVKNNKTGFCRYTGHKKQAKKSHHH